MDFSNFTKNNIYYFKKYNYNKNNLLIKRLIKEKSDIKKFIKEHKIDIDIKDYNFDIKLINSLVSSRWVMKDEVLNDLVNIPNEYNISWLNNNIYIKTTKDKIDKIKTRIGLLIYIIEYLKKLYNISKKVTIYMLLTNLKKTFPNKNEIVSINTANTGYTDFSHNKNHIFIWREEEFEKVTFHEIIHYFDLDKRDEYTKIDLKIKGMKNLYEGITDFWAVYYNLIYISMISQIKISKLLPIELEFMKNQALQLYIHFNLYNNNIIEQNTPAYAYYILKYLLFNYYLSHEININESYQSILNKILSWENNKNIFISEFNNNSHKKITSSRMTLFELA